MNIELYKEEFLNFLNKKVEVKEPKNLYQPIDYILQLGGKRLRPVLVLLVNDLFGGKIQEAMPAALAIEVFHNFTLIHDDIMDKAPIRRGKPTVHKKWNENIGILSGDAMLILAYQYLESYNGEMFKTLTTLFSKTAMEVCVGQQMDMDFETKNDVEITEYLEMIKNKTSVLVAAAMQMGAIIAGTKKNETEAIYNFGLNLGLAFQLQDDYLDTFGNQNEFGKRIGGDIDENKKTYLYLKTLELANDTDKSQLVYLYNSKGTTSKVEKVTHLFKKYKVDNLIKNEIEIYTRNAFEYLDELEISNDKKQVLKDFGTGLMTRTL
ncbi:MAG TPA: polyprenyl synthetase family protein [Flavobacteriaceae bacterium]|nr:polyprenyl synthetase family protein [Flavobacteriaceae bacterium]